MLKLGEQNVGMLNGDQVASSPARRRRRGGGADALRWSRCRATCGACSGGGEATCGAAWGRRMGRASSAGRREWPATEERREGRKMKIEFGIDLKAVVLCTNLKH